MFAVLVVEGMVGSPSWELLARSRKGYETGPQAAPSAWATHKNVAAFALGQVECF